MNSAPDHKESANPYGTCGVDWQTECLLIYEPQALDHLKEEECGKSYKLGSRQGGKIEIHCKYSYRLK